MSIRMPASRLEEDLFVRSFLAKHEKLILQFEAKLCNKSATTVDLDNAIRILKRDHNLLCALFRQCGITL